MTTEIDDVIGALLGPDLTAKLDAARAPWSATSRLEALKGGRWRGGFQPRSGCPTGDCARGQGNRGQGKAQ
jgi:hypothetical protein